MLCGWGVKAGMAYLHVELSAAISERFRKCNWYLKALYKCPGLFDSYLFQTATTRSVVKAKFHYAIWSQTGPKLVADLQPAGIWPII